MPDQTFLNGRVTVLQGDITEQQVDAIVNAANSTLLGGGGVDWAIHSVGGPEILAECRELRQARYPEGLPTGQVVVTTAGRLKARYVIHTVGPIKGHYGEDDSLLLASCYRHSLELAVQKGCTTIAFPAISTGMYDYPCEEAAVVSSNAIKEFLERDESLHEVRLVFLEPSDLGIFLKNQQFTVTGD